MSEITKDQHYVPKLYLRKFADSTKSLSVLDIKARRLLPRRPYPSVCYAKFYYAEKTGENDELAQSIENWLRVHENWIAAHIGDIISKILSDRHLEEADRHVLSVLMCLMWLRGPRMRSQVNRMNEHLIKKTFAMYPDKLLDNWVSETGTHLADDERANMIEMYKSESYNLEFSNTTHLKFMVDELGLNGPGFTNLFFAKNWKIYIAKGSSRFVTSDQPLVEWFPKRKHPMIGVTFFERSHYLALTPEILIELTQPRDFSKIRRKSLFSGDDDSVQMFNLLIIDRAGAYAYSKREEDLRVLITHLESPGKAAELFVSKFVHQ